MAVTATLVPSPTPVVHDVFHTLVQVIAPHYFELAQIVTFLGTGAALSVLHSVFLSSRLPKWANKALPVAYAALYSVANLALKGNLDWNNWYMVFVQVLTGAVAWYAVSSVVNQAQPAPSGLPTTTTP